MEAGEDLTLADSLCVDALRPSPNHGSRIGRETPDCIVLHYTGMPESAQAVDWLCTPASQVSCHYVVREDGHILQLVAERRRAWHAGRSFWAGETDLNSASIGIEIANPGHAGGLPPYPEAQVTAVVRLCRDITSRRRIDPARILAHSDIAPGRKDDPGERFPWQALWRAGIGLWVAEQAGAADDVTLDLGMAGKDVEAWQVALASYGYGIATHGSYDAATATVVRAFQRRYRPRLIDGRADPATRATLAALLDARRRPPAQDARL